MKVSRSVVSFSTRTRRKGKKGTAIFTRKAIADGISATTEGSPVDLYEPNSFFVSSFRCSMRTGSPWTIEDCYQSRSKGVSTSCHGFLHCLRENGWRRDIFYYHVLIGAVDELKMETFLRVSGVPLLMKLLYSKHTIVRGHARLRRPWFNE